MLDIGFLSFSLVSFCLISLIQGFSVVWSSSRLSTRAGTNPNQLVTLQLRVFTFHFLLLRCRRGGTITLRRCCCYFVLYVGYRGRLGCHVCPVARQVALQAQCCLVGKDTSACVCASACVFVQSCELEQMGRGGPHCVCVCVCVLWHGLG